MRAFRLAASLGVLCATSCSPDETVVVHWTLLTPAPTGGVFSTNEVSLPEGSTASARATMWPENDQDRSCDPVITSRDDGVLRAESAERGVTVFTGVSRGTTELVAECSGLEVTLGAVTTASASP